MEGIVWNKNLEVYICYAAEHVHRDTSLTQKLKGNSLKIRGKERW